jgi:hypothetical protein
MEAGSKMKKFFKILAGLAVFVLLALIAVLIVTGDERETARSFVIELTSGQVEQAYTRAHSGLKEQLPMAIAQQQLEGVKPYTEVSFSSIETSGGATTMKGTARTADGCASEVEFRVLESQIISFNITPLCK